MPTFGGQGPTETSNGEHLEGTIPLPTTPTEDMCGVENSFASIDSAVANDSKVHFDPGIKEEVEMQEEFGDSPPPKFVKRQATGPLTEHEDKFIRKGRGRYADKVHVFLQEPDSSLSARLYGYFSNAINVASVIMPLLQSLNPPAIEGWTAAAFEVAFETLFLFEIAIRFIVVPDRIAFFRSEHNCIDVFAVLPLIFRASVGFTPDPSKGAPEQTFADILWSVVPIFRIFKLLRRFQKFLLLKKAFWLAAEALPVLLYCLVTIALTFSCLIFLVEPRTNIPTLPDAMWLTIVTMTTVGYGDITPESGPGYCIVTVLIVCSALYMAIPLGIVGAAFTNIWKQRDCLLLVQRTKDQMDQRGYTAHDLPCLFKLYDSDHDGELSVADFLKMIEAMNINLPQERVIELFETFDTDGGGSIDCAEFIRQIFPKSYQDIYDEDETEPMWKADSPSKVKSMSTESTESSGTSFFSGRRPSGSHTNLETSLSKSSSWRSNKKGSF